MAVASSMGVHAVSVFCHASVADTYRSTLLPAAPVGLGRSGLLQAQLAGGAGDHWRVAGNRKRRRSPCALFGGGGESGGNKPQEKRFISREEEPQQYWQTADEKSGKGPMSSPLPYIALLGILSPFLILAVAYFNNWIKVPAS